MEVIIIALILILIGFMGICWVQKDKIQEMGEKCLSLLEQNSRLLYNNVSLREQVEKTEKERDEYKAALMNWHESEEQQNEIICYTCGGNGNCMEGCRFTVGAAGCIKYRRQER